MTMTRFRKYRLRLLLLGVTVGHVCMLIMIVNLSRPMVDKLKQAENVTSNHLGLVGKRGTEGSTTGSDVTMSEVRHVVYLKVHKAASTTMMNIFMRFGMSRDLQIMVPKEENVFSQVYHLEPTQFLHYTPSGLYDILCCHVIYNKTAMAPYFPKDTRYIGIVRHPFQQFLSAFLYYRSVHKVSYLVQIPGNNPVSTYLDAPHKYEPDHALSSFTNNRMALDFGYPFEQFRNISHMHVYAKQLQNEFDFVMIVEYFDESLVMLKRMFGWKLKDILYIPSQSGKGDNFFIPSQEDVDKHRNWAQLDYILYETFLAIFLTKFDGEDESFFAELNEFRSIRYEMEEFCTTTKDNALEIKQTRWNKVFIVTRQDCDLMLMHSRKLISLVKGRYVNM